MESRLDYVNELRQLGLTEEQVELKLRSEGLDREGKVHIPLLQMMEKVNFYIKNKIFTISSMTSQVFFLNHPCFHYKQLITHTTTRKFTDELIFYLPYSLQLLVKRSKYGEDPAVYKEKLETIEAKILAKNKLLEESVKFAGTYLRFIQP